MRKPSFAYAKTKAQISRAVTQMDSFLMRRLICNLTSLSTEFEGESLIQKTSILHYYAKTKTQISSAVTEQLISAFVFATRIVQCLYFLNPIVQVCDCTDRFMSDQVGNLEDRFSRVAAHLTVM